MIQGNIQNRLYNHEAAPPPGAWQRIARALDEKKTSPAVIAAKQPAQPPTPANPQANNATPTPTS